MELTDWIQVVAVLVAVGASLVALYISDRDRANARQIAAADRRAALRQAKLLVDLENLTRLAENLNRGGSTDPAETKRMGAEALTLIGLIGPDLLPTLWDKRLGSNAKLQAKLRDEEFPEFKKHAIEAQLAVNTVVDRIRVESSRGESN